MWQRSGQLFRLTRHSLAGRPAGFCLSTIAIALLVIALRALGLGLGLTNVALLLLLVTVISAAAWGWTVGICVSVLSNLAFNFFFVPPVYRFSVQEPNNALALVLFLGVAAITASLLASGRRSAREAERRASDTQTLLALVRTTRDQSVEALPRAICDWIVRDFGVASCTIFRLEDEDLEPVAHAGAGKGELSRAERSVALQAAGSRRSAGLDYRRARLGRRRHLPVEAGRLFVPLAIEQACVGVLRIQSSGSPLSDERERLLEAFADEAASALQRVSLARSAQAAVLLQESDRLKSSLLSSVSHDLRTPLTAIKASVANLMSSEVDWSEGARQEFLGAIDREADRLTRLVTNLLDLSRIEAGALRLDTDWNDLEELITNAIDRAEQAAPDREISFDLPEAIPLLRFDYVQIDRVMANLLDNALKYSPAGSPIQVRVGVEPEEVSVSVRDIGDGIAASEQTRVFDPFYRSERRSRSVGGSGLGLAICRGIVEAHGGRIWAERDGGAVLRFILPRDPTAIARQISRPLPALPERMTAP
jgi:two-component system sensor histidine kinase KdpD